MEGRQPKTASEEIAEILGHNLARHRLAQGLTQDVVAERADMHRTEVGLIERGGRRPRADTLFKLIGAIGIGLDQAFEGARWTLFDGKPGGYVEKKPPSGP